MDLSVLAEKIAAVERHLARVEARLPPVPEVLTPGTDASDAVVLHLWQATQIAIDLAMSLAVGRGMATPQSYAGAFIALAAAGVLDGALAQRMALAAGFRNRIVHAYEGLDMAMVTTAARTGPTDLRAFLSAVVSAVAAP